ncbi:MAG: CHASE2 domain-containing protein, partial [Pseudomonadota bacterium]
MAGALIGLVLWVLPAVAGLERFLYDRLSVTAAPDPSLGEIVIVGIDEPSFAEIGRWPWDRSVHAALIDQISAQGATGIGIDLLFAEPSQSAAEDEALRDALRRAQDRGVPVVLAASRSVIETGVARQVVSIRPLEMFTEDGGAVAGFVTLPVDVDGAVRHMPSEREGFASLLAAFTGAFNGAGDRIRFAASDWPYASAYQAVRADEDLPADFFSGKMVLIGYWSSVEAGLDQGADSFRTPLTAWGAALTPGVAIHAS